MEHADPDLLVSYPWGCYRRALHEIARVLARFGDPQPQVEKTGVQGISVVHTSLDNRDVIARCKELHLGERPFRFAIKWVPVDHWCETDLDAIKRLIDEKVAPCISEHETWGMEVEKRGWPAYHTAEIIERLAADIERTVNLRSPDKIVRVEILRSKTAISLLRPGEIFSARVARDRFAPEDLPREGVEPQDGAQQ
jgi:tRNA(Ser,Leu) C12 N-acetylase TAN1